MTVWRDAVVGACALACYANSLNGQMLYDDIPAIVDNEDIRSGLTSWKNLFFNDFWGTPIQKEWSHKSYRPLTVLSFRWNFSLHELEPFGYHLVNVLLHTIASILVHRLYLRFGLKDVSSFLAAIWFALHPIHTDAVSSIVGRAELISAVFYVNALLLCLKSSDNGSSKYFLMSIAFGAAGTLSKEQSFAFFPMAAIIVSLKKRGNSFKCEKLYKHQLVKVGTAFVGLLVHRVMLAGINPPIFYKYDNPARTEPISTRWLTYNYLLALNSWLILFPFNLCCDWTFNSIPLVESITDLRNLGTVAVYLSLLLLIGTVVLRINIQSYRRKIILGLSMTILPFLPSSNLLFPVGFVVAERILYLPTIGIGLLIGLGLETLLNRWKKSYRILLGIMITLLTLLFLKTVTRNEDWNSSSSLYRSGLNVNPHNIKLLNNYGMTLQKNGDYSESLKYYLKAMKLEINDFRAFLNAGKLMRSLKLTKEAELYMLAAADLVLDKLLEEKKGTSAELGVLTEIASLLSDRPNKTGFEKAEQIIHQVIIMRPDYIPAYIQRGELFLAMNKTLDALDMFEKAINLQRNEGKRENPDLLNNYGLLLADSGKKREALKVFSHALSLDPYHQNCLENLVYLIQMSENGNDKDAAMAKLHEIIEGIGIKRPHPMVFFQLGMLALNRSETKIAKEWFERALEANPTLDGALYNIALILIRENQIREALPYLNRLLELRPNHKNALSLFSSIQNAFRQV